MNALDGAGERRGEGFFSFGYAIYSFWWLGGFDMEWIEGGRWGGMRVDGSCAGRERKEEKKEKRLGG